MSTRRSCPCSLLLTSLLVLAACASTQESRGADDPTWLVAKPGLQEEIERNAQRLPWVQNFEARVELISWFAGVGEPAYETLLALSEDPRPVVAGSALAALGATGDSRLVEPIRARDASHDPTIELERARALMRLGDWTAAPTLIDALTSESVYIRAIAARSLAEITGETLGYEAKGEESERAAAVARWRQWWSRRSLDPLR